MRNQVIYEMTKEHLETGLRDIPVGYCPTSFVDKEKGVFYVGRHILQLATLEPKDVIYLLINGVEGTKEEVEAFEKDISNRSFISDEVRKNIRSLPKNLDPMQMLAISLIFLGEEKTEDDFGNCLNIIAKIPILVAEIINYHANWDKIEKSSESYEYMSNFLDLLSCPNLNREKFLKILKLINVLHYDHGGGSIEAFVSKCVLSTDQDFFSSLSAGIQAFGGNLNSKASIHSYNFLKDLVEKDETITNENIEKSIYENIANNKRIYGFGHPSLKEEDPRATVLYQFLQDNYPLQSLTQPALMLRHIAKNVLMKKNNISNPNANIDSIAGVALAVEGFEYPQYFPIIQAMSRIVGITIQLYYEKKDKKRMPVISPYYFYRRKN
jgi:citrate synthase